MAPDSVIQNANRRRRTSCATDRIELEHDPEKQALGRQSERAVPVSPNNAGMRLTLTSSDPEII
jgi:hypothetical protein